MIPSAWRLFLGTLVLFLLPGVFMLGCVIQLYGPEEDPGFFGSLVIFLLLRVPSCFGAWWVHLRIEGKLGMSIENEGSRPGWAQSGGGSWAMKWTALGGNGGHVEIGPVREDGSIWVEAKDSGDGETGCVTLTREQWNHLPHQGYEARVRYWKAKAEYERLLRVDGTGILSAAASRQLKRLEVDLDELGLAP